MDFDTIVESRRSVREFKNKKVSWKIVLEAINAANHAPFADNRNHLKFIVIEEPKTIDQVATITRQTWINESSIVVIVCSDDTNLENMHGERGRVYSRQQSGAAIENLLLKLTEQGISSCWVGSYDDEKIRKQFKIPSKIQIEAIIPIGYAKTKPVKKRKRALDTTLYWEHWDQDRRPALFKEKMNED